MAETKPLILAIDDEADILELMRRVLQVAEYEVITASDGNQGLDMVSERDPDLVLLDIKMPGKSGLEVLEEMRRNHPNTAVVMATGMGDVKTAIKAMQMGAYDYIVKPFSVNEIAPKVGKALEKRKLILDNQRYLNDLETKTVEQTYQLEGKINELTSLNRLFQTHLHQRFKSEEAYNYLTDKISKTVHQMLDLGKELESHKEQMQSLTDDTLKQPVTSSNKAV